jgi:hypothetical protein
LLNFSHAAPILCSKSLSPLISEINTLIEQVKNHEFFSNSKETAEITFDVSEQDEISLQNLETFIAAHTVAKNLAAESNDEVIENVVEMVDEIIRKTVDYVQARSEPNAEATSVVPIDIMKSLQDLNIEVQINSFLAMLFKIQDILIKEEKSCAHF